MRKNTQKTAWDKRVMAPGITSGKASESESEKKTSEKTVKLLCLADLHRLEFDRLAMAEQDRWLDQLLTENAPDIVVILGDVFEEKSEANPYQELARVFGELPVVCTLGNHEFYGFNVRQVLKRYEELYRPEAWNVHYLDVIGAFDFGNLHFFGNVLWYDGSLATIPGQTLTDFAGGTWRDREIVDFDPVAENHRCVTQIMTNQPKEEQTGILCTHCVPHYALNRHMQKTSSPYNAFSGMANFLDQVSCEYVLCAHTHWPIIGKVIGNKRCWNVGNGYEPPFKHISLDITVH